LGKIPVSVHGLVDSHCHLDASEFDADRDAVVEQALQAGVGKIVVPAIGRINFDQVLALAERYPCCFPALGIHPLFAEQAQSEDLDVLRDKLQGARPVAIGEIGLDFFVEGLDREKQDYYFVEQLKLAREFDLPVILHVRRSVDQVLKHLRRIRVTGGIAHAFNGSRQQADIFIKMGFKLGFGGAMTWARALHLRELAATLPLESLVLETDAPDIPPEWLGRSGRNSPEHLPRIARVLAELRQIELREVIEKTAQNVCEVLPRMG
jgi:TatD DNase family protein